MPGAPLRFLLPALLACLLAGCAAHSGNADAPEFVDLRTQTILVAGGSGRAGRYVLQHLRAEGLRFRATTRSRAEAAARLGPDFEGVDWIEADLRDPAQARRAMQGIDRVISVIGANQVSGDNSAEFVDYGAVKNLVDAAVREKVQHVVLLTAIGVTDPAHPFNKATGGALGWRLKGEDCLRASGLTYTIVRPAGLVNEPAGKKGLRIEQGDRWQPLLRSTLSRDDLARVLIEVLQNPAARNATFELANDAALPPGDWRAQLNTLRPDH
ncbi:MAG: SDR family oxidoreductase [Gammaproteobacteria bacterium]|nr:SDR family oxidoreductase [Gammaproteobacteria bacterium]